MSTNSVITINETFNEDKLTAIYAHWDGGLDMANELDSNFAIAVDVLTLINKGDV